MAQGDSNVIVITKDAGGNVSLDTVINGPLPLPTTMVVIESAGKYCGFLGNDQLTNNGTFGHLIGAIWLQSLPVLRCKSSTDGGEGSCLANATLNRANARVFLDSNEHRKAGPF